MEKNDKRGKKRKYVRRTPVILSKEVPFIYKEAYKVLRTNLDFISSTSDIKSILITSAVPEESKSITAINLALTLAEDGHSVIVVECDLRKPSIAKYLNLGYGIKGLSSILSGSSALTDCIVELKKIKINVLPAGLLPPNPSELLNQKQMEQIIEELKQIYDYVILDTPPVNVVTDAMVVGRMVDGVLLIIRSKFASTKAIRLAKQRLEAVNIRILGTVLTRFNIKKAGWKMGYDYINYEYNVVYNKRKKRR